MMRAWIIAVAALFMTGVSATSAESSWRIEGVPGTASFILTTLIKTAPHAAYVFNCSSPTHVAVTHTSVTNLTDAQKRRKVPENWSGDLPAGAAFMALRPDGADVPMVEAASERNATGGWDLTIDVPKDDPMLQSLPTAEKVQLFTTGKSTAVQLTDDDRKIIADFIGQCVAAR